MIKKMSDKEYFAHKAISQSFLKAFKRSPAHALYALKHPNNRRGRSFRFTRPKKADSL